MAAPLHKVRKYEEIVLSPQFLSYTGKRNTGEKLMNEKVYSVSEAVRLIGVESHVLRYWEEELDIFIARTSQGHRVYSRQNVDLFCRVKELREEGLQLKAIRRVLNQTAGKAGESAEFAGFGSGGQNGCSDWKEEEEGTEEPDCEVVPVQETGSLEQFTAALRQMMEEVVREQNERLREDMENCIQDKIEEMYLQYFQMIQETAVSGEEGEKRGNLFRRLLYRLLGR